MAYEYELYEVLSRAQIRALQAHYQGSRMYVPKTTRQDHPIARIIGWETAKKLSAEFPSILFPMTRSLLVRERNERIRRDRAAGIPPARVAHRYGLTTRQIRKICQGYALGTGKPHFGLRRRRARAAFQGLEAHERHHTVEPEPDRRGA